MSDPGERLAGIRQRRATITPPPWEVTTTTDDQWFVHSPKLDAEIVVHDGEYTVDFAGAEATSEFIAHAPEDIDFLLLQIDRLRGLHADGHATCRVCGEPISKQVGQWWHDETSRDHDATL